METNQSPEPSSETTTRQKTADAKLFATDEPCRTALEKMTIHCGTQFRDREYGGVWEVLDINRQDSIVTVTRKQTMYRITAKTRLADLYQKWRRGHLVPAQVTDTSCDATDGTTPPADDATTRSPTQVLQLTPAPSGASTTGQPPTSEREDHD